MGFCRRCGDIVAGARCKCGGTAVAPVVPWNQEKQTDSTQDKWSKTYVQRARSVSPTRPITAHSTGPGLATTTEASPTKRFPRPVSYTPSSVNLVNRVSAHIASSTSGRPPSPLKYGTHTPAPEADILPSLNDTTLSKVYGSVLQPKESLTTHSCALCASPFPPDATIYPDPAAPDSSNFLCRPCYETNGGTMGICSTCSRSVLTLKSEGPFIHAAGQYWHKKCFNCSGCFKYIGESPMVDLLGRPSCAECFESCLKREPTTPKKYISTPTRNNPRAEKSNNIGGMSSTSKTDRRSREGSPAIEELEHRLGIAGDRHESPVLGDLSQRLAVMGKPGSNYLNGSPHRESRHLGHPARPPRCSADESPILPGHMRSPRRESRGSSSPEKITPLKYQSTGSPASAIDAIEEMKHRFTQATSPSQGISPLASPVIRSTPPLRLSRSISSMRSSPQTISTRKPSSTPSPTMPPQTPDLISDFSDTTTQSSLGLDSPPRNHEPEDVFSALDSYGTDHGSRYTPREFFDKPGATIAEETASQLGTPNSICSRASPPSRSFRPTSPAVSPTKSTHMKTPHRYLLDLPPSVPSDSHANSCAGCGSNLFSIQGGGKFLTVPGDGADAPSMTYHVDCFRCSVCNNTFDPNAGQAVFVKSSDGACHVECAPPSRIMIHKMPSVTYTPTNSNQVATPSLSRHPAKTVSSASPVFSGRSEASSRTTPPPLGTVSFPRFGSRTTCPGCTKSVSPMEQGVVPGPQNTRWHASCLVCGGKKEAPKGMIIWRAREDKKAVPGCGKRLDSGAKTGIDGGVWCRECVLLLGVNGSPQPSLSCAPLSPEFTGLIPQITNTTTIARQFTGLRGGGDPGLLRQLTGGGLGPTRSISPTKQLGRSRPKSVIGMRSAKSVDSGRGMFLVRQLTGA